MWLFNTFFTTFKLLLRYSQSNFKVLKKHSYFSSCSQTMSALAQEEGPGVPWPPWNFQDRVFLPNFAPWKANNQAFLWLLLCLAPLDWNPYASAACATHFPFKKLPDLIFLAFGQPNIILLLDITSKHVSFDTRFLQLFLLYFVTYDRKSWEQKIKLGRK